MEPGLSSKHVCLAIAQTARFTQPIIRIPLAAAIFRVHLAGTRGYTSDLAGTLTSRNYTAPRSYTASRGYTGEMLILLPPSEGKTPAPAGNAPVCFADLSFPELTAERESVLEELAAVSSGPDALTELKVGASLAAEVERNTRLLTEPAQPAIRTYTGVLFEALDYASFSPAERDAAHWSLLISSALWGILRPEDAIPAYRLSMGVKLGSVGALASFWKGALGTALEVTARDQLILDCRSAAYAKSWVTPPSQTLAVRVERVAADGSRKVVSHMAKHYRGLFARYLIQSGLAARPIDGSTAGIAEFLEAVSEDWSVECTLPTARKAGILTLLVHEQ